MWFSAEFNNGNSIQVLEIYYYKLYVRIMCNDYVMASTSYNVMLQAAL